MRVIKQGLFQPGEEKAQEYSINIFKYLMVGNEDEGAKISSLVPSDWTKSNGYKKKNLNTRRHFLYCGSGQTLKDCKEVVEFPPLEILNSCLDRDLGNAL